MANKNCNLVVIKFKNQQVIQYKTFGQEIPKWTKNLCLFGEARVVKIGKDGKLLDSGVTCTYVNYANKQLSDCYQMYNPKSGKIIETRDIQWLNKMFFRNNITNIPKADYIKTTKLMMKHNKVYSIMKKIQPTRMILMEIKPIKFQN